MDNTYSVKVINHCYTENSSTEVAGFNFNVYNLDYWRGSRSFEFQGYYFDGLTYGDLDLDKIALDGCKLSSLYLNTELTQAIDLDSKISETKNVTVYAISYGDPEKFILDITDSNRETDEHVSTKLISSSELAEMKETTPKDKLLPVKIIGVAVGAVLILAILAKILRKMGFRFGIHTGGNKK
ncbi:MAG: hypothetical protein Q4E47_00985 [Candidatus Saccharibacteria bacterium]|nr:hypothetical protein [Candidatus Saccharibacteria bacterium]